MDNQANNKEQYAKSVCLFLAELLRTRKVSLKRAAEIAQKVVANINLIDTERDFLRFIKELSHDFEELFHLESRIDLHLRVDERRQLEHRVQEFVAHMIGQDLHLAAGILQEAMKENVDKDALCAQFPQFEQFLTSHHLDQPSTYEFGN